MTPSGLAATTPQPGPVSTSDGTTGPPSTNGSSIAGAGIATPPATSTSSSSLVPQTSGGIDNTTAPAAAGPAPVPMDNSVLGAVSGAGPPAGLTISRQTISRQTTKTTNEGDADATTGDNSVDDGDITTGSATAAGNRSDAIVLHAGAATGDLALIDQAARVRNDGDAVASTGDNDGGDITSGDANALGNWSGSTVLQTAAATGDLALIDQAARVGNDGDAVAGTGGNTADDGDITTGNATALGNVSSTAAEQRIAADASSMQLDQSLGASNQGAADALTGDNSAEAGEDGDVTIVTGTADAVGNMARIEIGQTA